MDRQTYWDWSWRTNEDDWSSAAPFRTPIYPASRFKYEDEGQMREVQCGACGKTFEAKRKDAVYCGPSCRQYASRGRR